MRATLKFDGGQNISTPEEELAKNEVALSLNLSVNQKPGHLVKRPDSSKVTYQRAQGLVYLDASAQILAYFRFYKRNGDKYDLLFYDLAGQNVLKWVKYTAPSQGVITFPISGEIAPFFPSLGNEIRGLAFGDRLLLTNGVDLMMFFEDENSYGIMELTTPNVAPSGIIEMGATGILPPTLIEYKVAYYLDGQLDNLSNASPTSELVDGQYGFETKIDHVTLTIPISTNRRVSGRKIYRRYKIPAAGMGLADDAFSEWYMIKEVADNTTTEIVDNVTEAAQGSDIGLPESIDVIPIPKYMEEINNRIFYGNVTVPTSDAEADFAYRQIITIGNNVSQNFTNAIVEMVLQWNNPSAPGYIKYDAFEANEGNDIKLMLTETGMATPIGFTKTFNLSAKTITLKARIPELLIGASGANITLLYGKAGMISLSNWEDLYRKELLYLGIVALFDMDKYKGSNKIYNRVSDNHGAFHGGGGYIEFGSEDGGYCGGNSAQQFTGRHIQFKSGSGIYIDFDKLGLGDAIADGTIEFWFRFPDPPAVFDGYYTLFAYRNPTDPAPRLGILVRNDIDYGPCLAYPADSSIYLSRGDQIPEVAQIFDGNWHKILLSWGTGKGVFVLDNTVLDSSTFTSYTYGSACRYSLGTIYGEVAPGAGYWTTNFHIDELIITSRKKTSDEAQKAYLRETYFEYLPTISLSQPPFDLSENKQRNSYYWSDKDLPEKIPEINVQEVGSAAEITQLKKLKNNLCILKKNEVRLLNNTEMAVEYWNLSNNLTGDVKNLGLIAPDSLDSIEGAIIGLAPLGLFIYDGTGFLYPGKGKLDEYLRKLPQATLEVAKGIYYPKRREYWLFVNNRLFIFDLPSGKLTEYTGIEPTHFAIWEDDNGELVWTDKNDFKIYKILEDFDSDRINEIAIDCKSGVVNLWQAQFQAMRLRFNGGEKVDVNVDIDGDPHNYEYLDDDKKKPLKLGSQGEAIQFEITESSVKPLEIKDMEFEYQSLARKVKK